MVSVVAPQLSVVAPQLSDVAPLVLSSGSVDVHSILLQQSKPV